MALDPPDERNLPRAVILTAISEEFKAVRSFLDSSKRIKHPDGTIYQQGNFTDNGRAWQVSIAEIGAGNTGAAIEAERAIQFFKPSIVAFVGVAGGLKDVRIGDVVAATKVYGYEAGKSKEEFETRPDVFHSSYELEQEARAAVNDGLWQQRLKVIPDLQPRAFVAPIAAGEKVVSSTYSDAWALIKKSYGDALAVEMEGAGFLKAVHANQGVKAVVIRGISDLVDEKEKADAAGSQAVAAECAAAFMFDILANISSSNHPGTSLAIISDTSTTDIAQHKQQLNTATQFSVPIKREVLYTNLLPLLAYPSRLFIADSQYHTKKVLWDDLRKVDPTARGVCSLKAGQLYCFSNLREFPWNKVCDEGTVECFSIDEWAQADEAERKWLFVELLNNLLRDALLIRGIVYDKEKELYYFMGGKEQVARKLHYSSKKRQASRDVVKVYESSTEPKYVKYYRHHAFRSKFEIIEKRWYLKITPTYFYTSDGRNRSKYHESLVKGMKQHEGNGAVLGQVVMWANLMPSRGLYDQDESLFCFDRLMTIQTEHGVYDPAWSKGESSKKKVLYDASQQELDLMNL